MKSGNRTECALLEFALLLDVDLEGIDANSERMQTVPFSSERKRMTTICRLNGAT